MANHIQVRPPNNGSYNRPHTPRHTSIADTVPQEIVCLIASFASPITRWRMRAVSNFWKQALQHQQSLWHTLDYSIFNAENHLRATRCILDFAGTAVRAVEYYLSRPKLMFEDPFRQLFECCPRLQELSIASNDLPIGIFSNWTSTCHSLKMLRIFLSGAGWENGMDLLLSKTPNLEELVVEYLPHEQVSLPWPTQEMSLRALRKLTLIGRDLGSDHPAISFPDNLHQLAEAAPFIKHIRIEKLSQPDSDLTSHPFIDFNYLENLELVDNVPNWIPAQLPRSLERLIIRSKHGAHLWDDYPFTADGTPVVPNLKELSVNANFNVSYFEATLREMFEKSGCELEKLSIAPYDSEPETQPCQTELEYSPRFNVDDNTGTPMTLSLLDMAFLASLGDSDHDQWAEDFSARYGQSQCLKTQLWARLGSDGRLDHVKHLEIEDWAPKERADETRKELRNLFPHVDTFKSTFLTEDGIETVEEKADKMEE